MQRIVVIFAAVLCAAQPSACDLGIYTPTASLDDALTAGPSTTQDLELTLPRPSQRTADEPLEIARGLVAVP